MRNVNILNKRLQSSARRKSSIPPGRDVVHIIVIALVIFAAGWTLAYGGNFADASYSVAQTTDGGYIVTRYTYSCGTGESDVYLVKTDAASNESSNEAVFSMRSDSAELLYTPDSPSSSQNPAFSTTGDTIIFTLFDEGYNCGPAALYLMCPGEEPFLLLEDYDVDNVNLPGACWNGVVDKITFASDREDIDEIWTINSDGSAPFRVTHHLPPNYFTEPSFSPDGEWIVFEETQDTTEEEEYNSIWKIRADGTELTRLTNGPAGGTDDRQPNWSPIGDRILFQRHIPGSDNWDIFTMAPDGSDIQQVTTDPSSDTDASWSPDGLWIVHSTDYGALEHPSIFVISAAGGTPIRITNDPNSEDGAPSWSPDGNWIVFESHIASDEDSPSALWRIRTPDLSIEEGAKSSTFEIKTFPNPFNSSVAITAPAGAEVEIYDLRGTLRLRSVPDTPRSLSEVETTDNRAFIWTPDQTMASGIYLVKAQTKDGGTAEKKVMLVR